MGGQVVVEDLELGVPPVGAGPQHHRGLPARGQNEVLHTTRVSNFGVPVYRSAETIFLEDDGRSFRIEGREAFFPFLRRLIGPGRRGRDGSRRGLVPDTVFGLTMEQETRMTADGLEITQRTASPGRTFC